jgi:hypothetical protein
MRSARFFASQRRSVTTREAELHLIGQAEVAELDHAHEEGQRRSAPVRRVLVSESRPSLFAKVRRL